MIDEKLLNKKQLEQQQQGLGSYAYYQGVGLSKEAADAMANVGNGYKIEKDDLDNRVLVFDRSNAPYATSRDDVSLIGGVYTGDDGKLYNKELFGDTLASNQDVANYNKSKTGTTDWGSADSWGMKGLGGTALGLGNLGLGVMSYLDNKKTAEAQRGLMAQQALQNQFVLNTAIGRQADIANAFGKK